MTSTVAPGRLRPVCAAAVVAALLLSLLALCCCADQDGSAPSGRGDGVTAAAGHVDPDCAQASTAVAVLPAYPNAVAVLASPGALAAVVAAPETGPAADARPRAPVPHLLCVMRT